MTVLDINHYVMIYVDQQSAYQEVMYSNSARILDSSADDLRNRVLWPINS